MWVEGTVNETYIRRSLHTASWERAQGLAQEIESADDPKAPPKKEEPVTLEKAVKEYLADAKARDLAESTLSKLTTIFEKQFLTWAKAEGYTLLREMDLRAVQSLRTTWKDGGLAKKKKQERMTGFFLVLYPGWMDHHHSYPQSQANYRPPEADRLFSTQRIRKDS